MRTKQVQKFFDFSFKWALEILIKTNEFVLIIRSGKNYHTCTMNALTTSSFFAG